MILLVDNKYIDPEKNNRPTIVNRYTFFLTLSVISEKTPKLVNLMSADSLSNFQNLQNEDVEGAEVSLANIQNHIIQSAYLSPLQDSLNDLEEVYKKNAEDLYNSSNLINYILTEPLTA